MKIYKDGTLCRSGCGGTPTFSISGMTLEGTKEYWTKLISLIDDKIVEHPINYQDEQISSPLEYFIAFYGVSSNGETGEQAKWTKSSGARFLLDNNTSFRHPLLGFLDNFAIQAAEITNEWFFDIVMTAVYGLKPISLEQTFVTVPKTEAEKQEALSRYVNQIMANSPRGWDIVKLGNGRQFKSKEGRVLTASVENNAGQVSINFNEVFGKDDFEAANKRLMEMLGQEPNTSNTQKPKDSEEHPPSQKPSSKPEGRPSKKWWEFWK